jgi:hypothetical protein
MGGNAVRSNLKAGAVLGRVGVAIAAAALALGPVGASKVLAAASPGDDAYVALEDQTQFVPAPGVLANDLVAPGLDKCIVIDATNTTGLQGELTKFDTSGAFEYVPPANYSGVTSFQYGIAEIDEFDVCPEAAESAVLATVTLTVTPVNDPPTISKVSNCLAAITVAEDSGPFQKSDCVNFDNAGPGESQALAAWVVTTASPALFSVQPMVTLDDPWLFKFTPAANAYGTTQVTVKARDGGGTASGGVDLSAGVTIDVTISPVNDAPDATADSFDVAAGETLIVPAAGVLANDSDIDGSALSAVQVTGPTHGVLVLAANGSFSYTPAFGYTGLDAFSYRATDGTLSSQARIVTVNILAPSQAPTPTTGPATVAPSAEPSPSASLEASPSADPGASPTEPAGTFTAPSVAPGASEPPEPVGEMGGGPSIPVVIVLLLVVSLLAFGAAFALPRWLKARSAQPPDLG